MTWSYSGDPSSSTLDEVRFYVQDVDATRQLLTNEELTFLVNQQANLVFDPTDAALQAAINACGIIAVRYAGETSISADGVSIDTTGLRQAYLEIQAALREFRATLQGASATPYAGGMDPCEDFGDPGVAPKTFGTGMTDNPRAGRQDFGTRGWTPPEVVTEWP